MLTGKPSSNWFDDVDNIVSSDLAFKSKLNIGEDAYMTLRLKKRLGELWNVAGVAGSSAAVAKSSLVASTFFAPTGLLAAFGIGAAVTPIGWVVALAVVSGGACYGITRYLKDASNSKVIVIPHFINTPMDVLALGLFDLMAPLALKVAEVDGNIDESERKYIHNYFVKEWGYDQIFIERGLLFTERQLAGFSINELSKTLATFQKENSDCNFDAMSKEIIYFLKGIMEADGREDEHEKKAIEEVQTIFNETGQSSFGKLLTSASAAVTTASEEFRSGSDKAQETLTDLFKRKGEKGSTQEEAIEDTITLRLDRATPAELERMRTFLNLKQSEDAHEIACEYRSAAGNSFVNAARQFDLAAKISYREILVDVFEKIRPVGDDIKAWPDKATTVFKKLRDLQVDESMQEIPIDQLEQALIEMSKKKINDALENMSADEKDNWRKKAEEEMKGSAGHADFSWSNISAFAGNNVKAAMPLFSFVPIGSAGAQATKILGGLRAGALFIPAATTAAAVSAIFISIVLSRPAYRKTVSATLELILIGRRQSAELEMNK